MKKIKLLFAVAVAATVLTGCSKSGGASMGGDNQFPVRTLGTQNATLHTTYPATLKGIQDVEIRPKVSGFITKVYVQEGQAVRAGQVLFTIDSETYEAAVRQAAAAVNSAKAQLNQAKLTYTNNEALFKNKIIGNYELQNSLNSYETAKASVAQAEAALASARENLSFCTVHSPANGYIGSLPYKVGALVSPSVATPLTTVSNTNTIEVFFSMTEKDMLTLTKKAGNATMAIKDIPAVQLQLADGSTYNHEGRVVKMSGVVDPATGSISMIAHFANPEHLLRSGASGSIVIPQNDRNAIVIPQEATSQVQDKIFVYLLTEGNKVKYTEIKVNPENDGSNYVVTSGLKAGDKIVTKGLTKLSDGMEITPITEAQYEQNIKKAQSLGKDQGTAKGFVNAMKSK